MNKSDFDNGLVLLWGVELAKPNLLKKYDKGDLNPNKRIKKEKIDIEEEEIKPVKANKKFIVGETYGIEDLDFLNEEYDRIQKDMKTAKGKELDDLYDEEEAILETIEGLEAMKEFKGGKIDNIVINEVKETKQSKQTKPKEKINSVTSKARVQKGSEEAKERMRKLLEAKRVKKALREQEIVESKVDVNKLGGRPYYYLGDIPKGYRPATEYEAIKNNKVGKYGKYKVDPSIYGYYKDYEILLNPNANENELRAQMLALKKKTLRAYENIDIFSSKIENDKYKDRKDEFKNKLNRAKDERKVYNAMYNFYYKIFCNLKGIKYERVKITPPQKYIPDENKPALVKEVEYKPTIDYTKKIKPIEDEEIVFKTSNKEIKLNKDYFDNDNTLKSKYSKKLSKMGLYLREKYYKQTDLDKYFFI